MPAYVTFLIDIRDPAGFDADQRARPAPGRAVASAG